MKKRTSKSVTALLLSLIMVLSLALTACGGEPETLESYLNDNDEVMEQMESAQSSMQSSDMDMKVYAEGNTLIYEYTYGTTYDSDTVKVMSEQFESMTSSFDSTFDGVKESLTESTGIDDITIRVVYCNGDGSEIWSGDF